MKADVVSDLSFDYSFIYNNSFMGNGLMNLTSIKATPQYQDFAVKLQWLYDAIDSTYGALYSYPWILYMCSGMTVDQLRTYVKQSVDHWLGSGIRKFSATSPDIPTGQQSI